jgi:hypothetical protein
MAAGIEGNRPSGYPRIALHAQELVLAWIEREEGALRVKTAAARVPPAASNP